MDKFSLPTFGHIALALTLGSALLLPIWNKPQSTVEFDRTPAMLPTLAAATESQADLRALILGAVASGQRRLVIPPGVYRVAPQGNESVMILIRRARNLEIVADGVTMICTKRIRALMFEQCENVTMRGLTLDYDPPTFTQGKVVAMAEDQTWLDIKIDTGYPHLLFDRIVICDPKTRFHKYGINHLWNAKATWAEPGTIRISRKDVARGVNLGDPVALSGGPDGGAAHAITVENRSSGVVFRNVTIHCAPGMGVVDFNSDIALKMLGCRVVPGPRPVGATEDRLLTTSWDGLQSQVARVGAHIEDTIIERCGDDSWSVPTQAFKVEKRDGRTLLLAAPGGASWDGGLRAGDRVIMRNQGKSAIQKIQTARMVSREIIGKTVHFIELTLDQELPANAGQYIFNLDNSSKGFIFRNNHVYSHGRGALVKVSDGLIEGNTFRGGDKAVVVNTELGNDSGAADRLVIRNNRIVETGHHQAMTWSEQAGAIGLSSSLGGGKLQPPGAFNDILIESNTFDRVKGLNLFISSARNVQVRNNRFLNTHTTDPERHNGADYNLDATSVIEVLQSDGVHFSGNTIEKLGPFAKHAVRVGPSAQNVTGLANGVRVIAR